ncbi:glycerophosphocholine cholinephosphodiesterase ENPP6-like [Parasteatoda tepidariorum]|uniref:glycerophosphocholine cholinephosphodiesterase ENPP6-like n=1 Tax=Parasteatoda tepidariorum TaxID=114398 RepID=UPI0039BC37B9
MYDKERDDLFLMALHSNASHSHWWNNAEPVWVTAEKRDLKSAVYWWDGCQVPIHGIKPTKCEEYANYWVWGKVNRDTQDAFTDLLDKFQKDNFRLGMVYYEAVDANGHFSGPDSVDRIQSLLDIDAILNTLQDEIARRGLERQVNLIVVSDHGMLAINPSKAKVIDIEKAIDLDDVKLMLDRGAVSMILPQTGRADKLYQDLIRANLKGLNVYEKKDIPNQYHLRKNKLVQPLLLVADEGYVIKALSNPRKMKPFAERIFKGYHGYDPYKVRDMRTIFYARGPAFKKGYVSSPLQMVDHYQVICRAMGMEPLKNNGSWSRVKDMLAGNALKGESLIGPDKKPKTVKFSKSNLGNKKKNNFRGKRKGFASSSSTSVDPQLFFSLFPYLLIFLISQRIINMIIH